MTLRLGLLECAGAWWVPVGEYVFLQPCLSLGLTMVALCGCCAVCMRASWRIRS